MDHRRCSHLARGRWTNRPRQQGAEGPDVAADDICSCGRRDPSRPYSLRTHQGVRARI